MYYFFLLFKRYLQLAIKCINVTMSSLSLFAHEYSNFPESNYDIFCLIRLNLCATWLIVSCFLGLKNSMQVLKTTTTTKKLRRSTKKRRTTTTKKSKQEVRCLYHLTVWHLSQTNSSRGNACPPQTKSTEVSVFWSRKSTEQTRYWTHFGFNYESVC